MKSSLVNMVLVLFVIALVASAGVGGIYTLTKEPIEQARLQKKLNALSMVLPEFDNDPAADTTSFAEGDIIAMAYRAVKNGETVGYAVETSVNGFAGAVDIMTGFDMAGNIVNIQVLKQAETPGLGAKIAKEGNPVTTSIVGRNPADMKMSVKKDGGDVDAITASTISSRAYVRAVDMAYEVFKSVAGDGTASLDDNDQAAAEGADAAQDDATSGATESPSADGAGQTGDNENPAAGATEDTAAGTAQTLNGEKGNE